ncbi:MAG: 1-deoxy-D-xylulose-5-phosphate synthase [Oscillospiraceae bacterium]|jgi:1-deoxy-D-xylulose-5-phosphate synthase|nr:1-deoxy-D-xylulose-5-phosphate synthase [Oscillospiraceae bacterium]
MRLFERYLASVKDVPEDRLDSFCSEIRSFLIKHVAQTGGHLASNLGVVELTVALHRVFDTSRDRLVFDVGHQCYVHKLLTGRKEGFDKLRSLGGMSGFPKPSESIHDAFAAGHASTSVSAALGMARARTLQKEDYHCIALLGDGALTGGLAYEGLNDAGQSGEPLIVVLNDNGMSIKKNVGGVARHLTKLRLQPRYFQAKKFTHKLLDPLPGGRAVGRFIHRGKELLKNAVVPGSMFAQMGFEYLGPTDGHNIRAVTHLLRQAAAMRKPVLIHLVTQKGRGYTFSEQNPSKYHGVKSFRVDDGVSNGLECDEFSRFFGKTLTAMAGSDRKIVAITAAMQSGCGLEPFAERFPRRFFDVGIAEGHAVTMAAAMAKQGLRPVVSVYSTFLQRAYDQIVHDVAMQNLPVIFSVGHAGLSGEDGETHHGVFDPLYLSSVPGLTLLAPATFDELRAMLIRAFQMSGPVAIRYPKQAINLPENRDLSPVVCCRAGRDATIVTYGGTTQAALDAAELLDGRISVGVVRVTSLKPLPEIVCGGEVFILEDNPGYLCRFVRGVPVNTGDRFVTHGSNGDLLAHCRLDAASVAALIAETFETDRRYG